jgi:hypothetical protein
MADRTLRILPDPARPYAELKAHLVRLGWVWANEAQILPLLPSEPEWVEYTHPAGGRLRYEFNPAIGLRQIEATGSEGLLAPLSMLPRLCAADVEALLEDSRVEAILRGLFGVRALGLTDALNERVRSLREHDDDLVKRAATSVLGTMSFDNLARGHAPSNLKILCEQALPILAALVGPEGSAIIERLRPGSDDYTRVFQCDIASAVRTAYERLWSTPPEIERLTGGDIKVRVDAAPASMLLEENELSERFPGGYRTIAPHLQPDRIWFVWRYLRPGQESGMRYDGVVRLDDRWVWFPKPYRVVGEILRSPHS